MYIHLKFIFNVSLDAPLYTKLLTLTIILTISRFDAPAPPITVHADLVYDRS
jgi:hypothetical protein